MSLNLITCDFDEVIDELTKVQWRFHFWPEKGVCLEHRFYKTRATPRHAYRVDVEKSYDRLDHRHMKAEFPEIPLEVQLKAVEMLRDQVKFKGDSGGKWTRF
jgi:hypothetical protein